MKTMTCKQMGGPCDEEIKGATPEEMMENGEKHITEMAETDPEHQAAVDMMEQASTDPKMAEEWEKKFRADFAETSEDPA